MVALDRDRLIRDLRIAAEEAWPLRLDHKAVMRGEMKGMARAWKVLASAIEDGDYDEREEVQP